MSYHWLVDGEDADFPGHDGHADLYDLCVQLVDLTKDATHVLIDSRGPEGDEIFDILNRIRKLVTAQKSA